jgi:NTP pyrophosphatase (non-canonical NTP hydrolase)
VAETIEQLQVRLARFAEERDWDQFHTAKNLVMALAGEVGELVALFQWLTPEAASIVMDDPRSAQRVLEEMADVFGYLLRLADRLGVELDEALVQKLAINAEKYPVDRASGNSLKYTDL